MSIKWEISVGFAIQAAGEDCWDLIDGYSETFTFDNEREAREFYREASAAANIADGKYPSQAARDFVKQHDVTMLDLDGAPIGGYANGRPIGDYTLAIEDVFRVLRIENLSDSWEAWCEES